MQAVKALESTDEKGNQSDLATQIPDHKDGQHIDSMDGYGRDAFATQELPRVQKYLDKQ